MEKKPTILKRKARQFVGAVVKLSSLKTISVLVVTIKLNEKYSKRYKVANKYAVHDENGTAKVGDKVKFEECRPISHSKRWKLVSIVK